MTAKITASRNIHAGLVLVLSISLGAAGCGSGESSAPAGSTAPAAREAPMPSAPAQPKAPATPAAPAAPQAPAAPAAAADPARGDVVYQTYCASCHGTRGAGDGPVGQALDPKPARHDDGTYMNALSNEYLFKVIDEGGAAVGKSPLMAPWGGSLTDAQIWDVVAFVRTLAVPPYEGPTP
jgi:mono/diheme cytochrome c family protein